MVQYNFPFKVGKNGRTATTNKEEHIKQLIEQVLFTSLGERVNRPDFGSGINQLVFAPNSDELVTVTQFLVQGSLQRWLGDLIHVDLVEIQNVDSKLSITVKYKIIKNMMPQTAQFTKELSM